MSSIASLIFDTGWVDDYAENGFTARKSLRKKDLKRKRHRKFLEIQIRRKYISRITDSILSRQNSSVPKRFKKLMVVTERGRVLTCHKYEFPTENVFFSGVVPQTLETRLPKNDSPNKYLHPTLNNPTNLYEKWRPETSKTSSGITRQLRKNKLENCTKNAFAQLNKLKIF